MNLFQKIKSSPFAAAIVTGIISCFVWEILFTPLLPIILEKILSISNRIITAISDDIYQEISYGYRESGFSIIFAIIFGLFCSACAAMIFKAYNLYIDYRPKKNHDIDEASAPPLQQDCTDLATLSTNIAITEQRLQTLQTIKKELQETLSSLEIQRAKIAKKLFISSIFIAIITISYFSFFLARYIYVQNNVVRITNNIEIVAPYIDDIEYKFLKSQFHSIQNKEDFDALCQQLESLSKEHGTHLK